MIVSIGDGSIDYYVTTGEKHIGGIASNFAVQLRRLNEPVRLITAVGRDQNAKLFISTMAQEGVNTSHVHKLPGLTAEQNIRMNGTERVFCGYFPGVLADFQLDARDIEVMERSDMVVVPLTDGLKHLFEHVAKLDLPNVKKVADFSRDADIEGFTHGDVVAMLLHYLSYLDIAFMSGDDSVIEHVETIADANPEKLIIITLGSQGSIAFQNGERYSQLAAYREHAVDTTGCGDGFRAGFLADYIHHHDIPQALEKGALLAGKTAAVFGAF